MGLPGKASSIKGARMLLREEAIPRGWLVIKQTSLYNHIKPLDLVENNDLLGHDELRGLTGGSKSIWLRTHHQEVISYYEENGREPTMRHFRIWKETTMDAILEGGKAPFVEKYGKVDKLESLVLCNRVAIQDLRFEVKQLREEFAHFQETVAGQMMRKLLLPLIQSAIQMDDSFNSEPKSSSLSLGDLGLPTPQKLKGKGNGERSW